MSIPEISVILPFYNAEKSLEYALQSICEQTFQHFECLLIDNNSTDQSKDIAQLFCVRDTRFTLLHEAKQGVVHAHNKGLSVAQGRYIARMDADDWSFPNRLQVQFDFLESHPNADVIAGQAEYVAHKPETAGFARYVRWSNQIVSERDIYLKQFVESPIINPTAMWRKKASKIHGTYLQGPFPEDYELWLRWLSKGVKIHKIAQPVIMWYDSDNRLTRTKSQYSDESFFKIKTEYLSKWLQIHNPFHPKVMVWGASNISRKRAKLLKIHGIEIAGYIDISLKRKLDSDVIHYENIPPPYDVFVLVYLKQEKMRSETMEFLEAKGFEEGVSYLLVS